MIEMRNDTLRTPADVADWVARIAQAYRTIERELMQTCFGAR